MATVRQVVALGLMQLEIGSSFVTHTFSMQRCIIPSVDQKDSQVPPLIGLYWEEIEIYERTASPRHAFVSLLPFFSMKAMQGSEIRLSVDSHMAIHTTTRNGCILAALTDLSTLIAPRFNGQPSWEEKRRKRYVFFLPIFAEAPYGGSR